MSIEQRRGERCTDPGCPDRREGYQHAHMRLSGHPMDRVIKDKMAKMLADGAKIVDEWMKTEQGRG
jgi:hypothetical protein